MKILFVLAHPDDETFGSGGTIAKYSKDHTVKLVCATRGEAGELGTPPVATREKLGSVREKELRAAAKVLGIKEIFFLNYIDRTVKKVPRKELSGKILKILEKEAPDVVVTSGKEGSTGHPDHIAVGFAATDAFKQYMETSKKKVNLYYRVIPSSVLKILLKAGLFTFADVKGEPKENITTVIDISKTVKTKYKASALHRSQNKDFKMIQKVSKLGNYKKEHYTLATSNEL